MSTPFKANLSPEAGVNAELIKVPETAKFATGALDIVNTSSSDAKVTVAIAVSTVPGISEYIEFNSILAANGGQMTRPCQVILPGERVIIQSSVAGVAFRIAGLYEPA